MSPLDSMTADTTSVDLDALILGDWSPSIPPAWAVPVAVGTVADASRYVQPIGRIPEGPQWWVSVGPGRVKVGRTDVARLARRQERLGSGWVRGYANDAAECVRGRDRATATSMSREDRRRLGSWWRDDQSPQPVGAHAKLMRQQLGWARGEALRAAVSVLDASGVLGPGETGPDAAAEPLGRFASRARITEWSRKSRSNMVDRIATLDFEAFFADAAVPAMVTLTLPAQWFEIAPNGRLFKKLIGAFVKRYERAWDRRLRALWKLEFQRRGAPHLHLLMVPPRGQLEDGTTWRQWFASTWSDLVCDAWLTNTMQHHQEDFSWCVEAPEVGCEAEGLGKGICELCAMRRDVYVVHYHRDAACNYSEGLRASDPKRISVYFSKHSAKASGSKEYQHIVPWQWRGEGDGPGRFWGYWALERGDKSTHVTSLEAIAIIRAWRRWDASKGGTRRAAVIRTDIRTGVVRSRTARRRTRRMTGPGYLVVQDGPSAGLLAADVIRPRPAPDWVTRSARLRERRLALEQLHPL